MLKMRIVVDPEQLRNLAQQIRYANTQLNTTTQLASNTFNGIDFESRQKVGMDVQVEQAITKAKMLTQNGDALAQYLEYKASVFQEADQGCTIGITQIGTKYLEWQHSFMSDPRMLTTLFPKDELNLQIGLGTINN
jgi:hypothetical protein